jgi:hypothetical protein
LVIDVLRDPKAKRMEQLVIRLMGNVARFELDDIRSWVGLIDGVTIGNEEPVGSGEVANRGKQCLISTSEEEYLVEWLYVVDDLGLRQVTMR